MYGDEDNSVTCNRCLYKMHYGYCSSCQDLKIDELQEKIDIQEEQIKNLEDRLLKLAERVIPSGET